MKTKIFTLISLSIVALLLATTLVSAVATTFNVNTNSITFTQSSSGAKDFIISNPMNSSVTIKVLSTISIGTDNFDVTSTGTIPSSGMLLITLTADGTSGDSKTITITPQNDIDFSDLDFQESLSDNLELVDDGDSSQTETIRVEIENSNFCSIDNPADLRVRVDDVNIKGFSDDENEFYLGDEVTIDARIDNDGNWDVQDIELSWCLYDEDNKECVLDDDVSKIDLDHGDDDIITFSFTIDPKDLAEGVEDYTLYVSATGSIDDKDADALDGEDSCGSANEDFKLILGRDFAIVDDVRIDPETISCGNEVTITGDVWNAGDDDQDDITLRIFVDGLSDVSKSVDVGDIDSFDSEGFSTTLQFPQNAKEQTYHLKIWVFDDGGDVFESEDNDEAKFDFPLSVSGGCEDVIIGSPADITAELISGGEAGKDLVVKALVINKGTETQTFNLAVNGYESWASAEYAPTSLTLNSGQSGEVLITLKVNKDVEGTQSFTVRAQSGTDNPVVKTVEVPIEPRQGFSFPSITGGSIVNGDNWYLWGIGILNVILVIIIIVVAVRVARS